MPQAHPYGAVAVLHCPGDGKYANNWLVVSFIAYGAPFLLEKPVSECRPSLSRSVNFKLQEIN